MFVYIHGFNSSSLSNKAQLFKKWLISQQREREWICPDLPHRPSQAITRLTQAIENCHSAPKLVGSSLGGFYATILAEKLNLKAVAINPAVHPGLVLRDALGPQQSWHGDYSYEFTHHHLAELNELDIPAINRPDNILLMQEREDETLDWSEAAAFYRDCHQLIFRGGNHGFSRFEDVLELIDRF